MSSALELTIFAKLFASVAEDMGIVLRKSAFSPIIKERRDYSLATVSLHTERRRHGPYGLAGGGPGAPEENALVTQRDENHLPGKVNLRLPTGSLLSIRPPGGGGWGRSGEGG